MRAERTDAHRPSVIVPAHYEPVLSYSLATSEGGWPIPSISINCEPHPHAATVSPRWCCCVAAQADARDAGKQIYGAPGRCGSCGASFVYGELWRHTPTGDLVHLGHDCAAKYEMLMDRSAWELENRRVRAAAARECQKALNDDERERFLAANPGLAEALEETDHRIVRDIKARFVEYRSLSPKQVALVLKLATEAKTPPKPEEAHVAAPLGRVDFTGVVVSAKNQETNFGPVTRITVKVTAPGGTWLAWGTCPAVILDDARKGNLDLRGKVVALRATLQAGREPHFAFMKRPQGRLVPVPEV